LAGGNRATPESGAIAQRIFAETTGLSRNLKIHTALVIHLDRGSKIELGERNLLRGLRVEYPERFTGDRVIAHFFHMLVAENQRRRGFQVCLRPIARFDIGLQPVELCLQRLEIPRQCPAARVAWSRIRSTGIRILIFVVGMKRNTIIVPAVIAVGIISRVRVIRVIAPSSVGASLIVVAVSSPNTNAGAAPKTTAAKRAGGMHAGRVYA